MLWAALAVLPAVARAEEGPYSNFLVGERSMGLGGAFVAVADDTSALFHNPSGIASLSTSAYSGGLWAFFEGSRTIEGGYRTDLGSESLEHSAKLQLPSFLGGVVKFGKREADGVRPHALGAALMSPFINEYRFVAQLDGPGAVDRLEVRHSDSARWLGVSYAYRLRPGLAFGISVFGAQRVVSHDEVEILARNGDADVDPVENGRSYARASTVNVSAYQMIVRFGMHVDLAQELRAGIMFQPPGLDVTGSAGAEHSTVTVSATPVNVISEHDSDLGYNLPTPWELRFGLGYIAHEGGLISIDLSIFGPAGSKSNPLPLVETDNINYGLFVPRATYRQPSLRGALGFEAEITEVFPIRGGIFFERSSAPEVLSISPYYVRDRVDRVGLALSIGIRAGGYDVAIGSSATLGTGEDLGVRRTETGLSYFAADVVDKRIMVFLGGGNHAVRQLVGSVFE